MSWNQWVQIWNAWHCSDNAELDDEADRLYKVRPVLQHLVDCFKTVHKPSQ
jgi:hypothetical protein